MRRIVLQGEKQMGLYMAFMLDYPLAELLENWPAISH